MRNKKFTLAKRPICQWLLFVFMLLLAIILVTPILWLFSASFQNNADIYKTSFDWIPKTFHIENYVNAWNIAKLGSAFQTTVFVSAIMLCFHLFLCSLSGYVIAKYHFRFKKLILTLIMATMMLPQEVTYFPVYSLMREMHLINTYFGLAFPFFVSGIGVFLMVQFAQYVPTEVIESARIDGCGEWRIFFKIGFPIMIPSVSALAILAFTFIWNEYAWARLAVSSDSMRTLSITLSMLANNSDNVIRTVELLAGGVITMLPVLILFLCFQKNFIESVTRSGLKG